MKKLSKEKLFKILLFCTAIIATYLMFFTQKESNFDSLENLTDLSLIEADYYFIADELEFQFFPGLTSPAYSYNQQIPGPLIDVNLGDRKKIALINNLDVETTIHYHGVIPDNSMDGVPGVTQDSVAPGEYFIYDIEFNDAGLFWYHSHVDGHEQVERGLQGPIVVRDEVSERSLKNVEEQIIMLDDVLINEDGSFYSFTAGRMHGRFGNVFLTNGKNNNEYQFDSNIVFFRLINSANARSFNFYSPNLSLTVLGDGIGLTKPYQSEFVTINPGERYDLLIEGEKNSQHILYHASSRDLTPLATISLGEITKDIELPIYNYDQETYNLLLNKEIDYSVELTGIRDHLKGLLWTLNGNHFPEKTEQFSWEKDQPIKVKLTNTQGQPHPMHFHGQKFFILSRDSVATEDYGLKDTVMVSRFEEVEIGFVPEVKGDWVYHCHILEHAEAGMLGILNIFEKKN